MNDMNSVGLKFSEILEKCNEGNVEYLKEWLGKNSPNSALGQEKYYPLEMACVLGIDSAVSLLIEHKANVHQVFGEGENHLLHYCCQNGWKRCATLLLEAGANINVQNKDFITHLGQNLPIYTCGGKTPLMASVEAGHPQLVEYLLSKNADISIKDTNGMDVFQISVNRSALAEREEFRRIMEDILNILKPYSTNPIPEISRNEA